MLITVSIEMIPRMPRLRQRAPTRKPANDVEQLTLNRVERLREQAVTDADAPIPAILFGRILDDGKMVKVAMLTLDGYETFKESNGLTNITDNAYTINFSHWNNAHGRPGNMVLAFTSELSGGMVR